MQPPHSTSLGSKLESRTPPPTTVKRHTNDHPSAEPTRAGSEHVNATLLSKALENVEEPNGHSRSRERTPAGSPSRKRQRIYGDRSVRLNWSYQKSRLKCTNLAGSSLIVRDEIYMQVTAFFMTIAPRQLLLNREDEHLMASSIFRGVCELYLLFLTFPY